MELRFDTMLYSNFGNENLMWAISNVYPGHKFPTPGLDHCFSTFLLQRKLPQVFVLFMELYAMIQVSILL